MHVESRELDASLAAPVEFAHPKNHPKDLFRLPCPEIHAPDELTRVTDAAKHVVIQSVSLGHVGFDRKYREPHSRREKLDHAVFQLEKLSASMRRLAERYHARIADRRAERFQVIKPVAGVDRAKRDRIRTNPFRCNPCGQQLWQLVRG